MAVTGLTLVSEPDKTMGNITSDVIAVKTQALYEIHRKDNDVTFSNSAGKLSLTIAGLDMRAFYAQYNSVYVGDDDGDYSKVATITSVPAFAAGDTTFNVSIDFDTTPSGGYVNNLTQKTGFSIDFRVKKKISGVWTPVTEWFSFVPDQVGILKADLKDIYLFLLEKDDILSLPVHPEYKSSYLGVDSNVNDLTALMIIRAEMQLHDQHGSNMLDFLLIPEKSYTVDSWVNSDSQQTARILDGAGVGNITGFFPPGKRITVDGTGIPFTDKRIMVVDSTNFSSPNNDIRMVAQHQSNWGSATIKPYIFGRWLTNFKHPRLWQFWDMELFYIMDSDFTSRTGATVPKFAEITVDINGVELLTLRNANGGVTEEVNEYKIVNNDVFNAAVRGLKIRVRDSDTGVINLIEPITLDYFTTSDAHPHDLINPVMIQWLNQYSGYDQWLFDVDQIIDSEYTKGRNTMRAITDDINDITYHTAGRDRIELNQKITVTASELTQNQLETIKYLSKSDKVYMWVQRDSAKRIGVTVDTNVHQYTNKDKRFDVSITIKMPSDYDFIKGNKIAAPWFD